MLAEVKKMKTRVIRKIVKEDIAIFEGSTENKLRSFKVLYSKGLMNKEKYKRARLSLATTTSSCSSSKCKRTGLKFMPNAPVPKLLPYAKLIGHVNSINIGNVHDFCTVFCCDLDDDSKVSGAYRDIEEFLIELQPRTKLVETNQKRVLISSLPGMETQS